MEPIPAAFGQETGYTLGRAPVYSDLIYMSLDCWKKPEHPERTNTDTERACKLCTERSQSSNRFEPNPFML